MSIRIHALAKELNVPNKELIDFINRRQDIYHLEIKTPSNAIDPFTAEAIGKDFAEYAASKAEQLSESANAANPRQKNLPIKSRKVPRRKQKRLKTKQKAPKQNLRRNSSRGKSQSQQRRSLNRSLRLRLQSDLRLSCPRQPIRRLRPFRLRRQNPRRQFRRALQKRRLRQFRRAFQSRLLPRCRRGFQRRLRPLFLRQDQKFQCRR